MAPGPGGEEEQDAAKGGKKPGPVQLVRKSFKKKNKELQEALT